jgi:putative ABC transport system permease protein
VYGGARGVTALLFWQAADVRLTATVLAGAVGTLLVLMLAAFALVRALNLLRGQVGIAWRYGLANIARRAQGSVTQILAFGLGIMVLLLLSLVRSDMLAAWQAAAVDALNQSHQRAARRQPMQAFSPHAACRKRACIRWCVGVSRLGRHPLRRRFPDDRARRLVEREFNLSYGAARRATASWPASGGRKARAPRTKCRWKRGWPTRSA